MLADGLPERLQGRVTRGRAAAAATMGDTLAFGSLGTGEDPDSGLEVDGVFIAAFTTPGKVSGGSRGRDQAVRTVTVGGTERVVVAGGIKIPADRPETVTPGMLVRVDELGPTSPTHLLGRTYRIVGESTTSHETSRRFDVVEVS